MYSSYTKTINLTICQIYINVYKQALAKYYKILYFKNSLLSTSQIKVGVKCKKSHFFDYKPQKPEQNPNKTPLKTIDKPIKILYKKIFAKSPKKVLQKNSTRAILKIVKQ